MLILFFSGQVLADDEDKEAIITGTPGPDVITVTIADVIDAQADIETAASEKVEASATGIDSLEGNDTITVNAPITAAAAANALLLQTPEKKTEAIATSTGITAQEGDDSVDNNLGINVLGSSLSAYGTALQFEQPAPPGDIPGQNNKKEIDASVSSKSETTGVMTGDGADSIENDGLLIINGLATSGGVAGDLSATVRESSTMKTTSASEVSSTGIQAGGDSDTIINDGAFITTATATGGALAVGLVAPGETTPPSDNKANIKTEANATSKATVTGIHGDEDELESNSGDSSPFGLNGLRVTYEKSETTVSGDDTIINNALQTGHATATSGAGSGSISNKVNGSVQTEAKAEAEATVTGINAGGGNDVVVNNGELLSTAIATSGALAVAVEIGATDANPPTPPPGSNPSKPPIPSRDKESKSSTDASATAKATAIGITADGDAHSVTSTWALEILDGALKIDYRKVVEYLHGNDAVTNRFSINSISRATSLTDSIGVTVSSSGSAKSKANAEAESYGASIVTGAGDDNITNRGLLTTKSTASATAVSIGLAVGQPPEDNGSDPPTPASSDKITSKSETNVSAKAYGYGIDADGLAENITTAGSLSISADGLNFNLSRDRELGSGNDTVNNVFAISVDSSANADAANASIQLDAVGSVDSEAKAAADALAEGIATGAGDDNIVNSGLLTVGANASADSISFGLSASKPPEGETTDQNGNTKKDTTNVKTDASATANATAVGIDAEGKDHLHGTAGGLQITGNGLDFHLSRGTESLAGSDSVTNTGIMTTTADATSGAVSAGISINAEGSVDSEASSKATARASGILTGGGDDSVDNRALLSSDSTATATALSVSVSVAQPTDSNGEKPSLWEKIKEKFASANSKANAEATSSAAGIDTEGDAGRQADSLNVNISSDGLQVDVDRLFTSSAGNDSVTNSGALNANSTARTLAGAADIKVETEGTAWSETNATAKADASGILTGGGADEVTNTGILTTLADAAAGSVSVSFTQPGGPAVKSKADSKAVAEAKATGISTDGGRESEMLDTSLNIGSEGIDFTWHTEKIASAEADTVINVGAITATALTLSGAGGAAVSMDGPANADVTAKSTSHAVAVDAGGGGDFIDNEGYLIANAGAVSGALSVSFGQKSEEKSKTTVEVKAGATSEATAIGIDGDSGADEITNINIAINSGGLATNALFKKSSAGGDDIIQNSGRVDTIATALSGGLGVAVAIDGAASSDVSSTSKASTVAIDAGAGDDSVLTTGSVSAISNAAGNAMSVTVGKKGEANKKPTNEAKATTKAVAEAIGIQGDSGKDTQVTASLNISLAGLSSAVSVSDAAAIGNDAINVQNDVTAFAEAASGAEAVSVAIDGVAKADVESNAKANAIAIEAGGGNDSVMVDQEAEINSIALANSFALAVGVGQKTSDEESARTQVGAESQAEAKAVGISTDGGDSSLSIDSGLSITLSGIDFNLEYDSSSVNGDDTVTNDGSITSFADANAAAASVPVTLKGTAISTTEVKADAESFAVNTGGGVDSVDNHGDLSSTSLANAASGDVTVSTKGAALSNGGLLSAGTEATSKAVGISSSGGAKKKTVNIGTLIDFDNVALEVDVATLDDSIGDDGADTITNTGGVTVFSGANAPEVSVGFSSKGVAASISNMKSESAASGIESGNGDDFISNQGELGVTAESTAAMANVQVTAKGLSLAVNSAWDGGTKSTADATGIDADTGKSHARTVEVDVSLEKAQVIYEDKITYASGNDEIINSGKIGTTAVSGVLSGSVAATGKGVSAAVSTAKSTANSTSIRGGDGDDTITNSGALTSDALSGAVAANVAITNKGVAAAADAVWDGGTTSESVAIGIAGDGGNSTETTRLAVGTDETGYKSNKEIASGVDTIHNTGAITTNADSGAASASVAVAVKGVGIATSTATSSATSKAIDAGAGDEVDDVYNAGELRSTATALAAGASVSVTNEGAALSAGSVWDGGTKATAESRGIDLGSGGETITNDGKVTSIANAGVVEAAIAVTMKGVAGATATATGKADAVAIDASAGDDKDTVNNTGDLTADAKAGAIAASVSVANKGLALASGAVWDGGTGAEAVASGIDVGDGADVINNSGDVTVNTLSGAAEAAVAVAVQGVAGAVATSTSESIAVAIKAGDDEDNAVDTVTNSGDLTATADAGGVSAAVSFSNQGVAIAGGAVWDGGTKAIADAKGIELGAGADAVDNSGDVTTQSISLVAELATSVSLTGVAGAVATSTGESRATAIHMGSGNAVDTVTNSGDLSATSGAGAVTAAVSVTNAGLAVAGGAVWDGGTKGISEARGIYMGAGNEATGDSVDNSGKITATSIGAAAEVAAAISVSGVAGATATSTGSSLAAAIDASEGDDDDTIINSGDLKADSTATAATTTVAFTNAGLAVATGAVWDGGTTANSKGLGIAVGAGEDTVDNSGDITANSRAAAAELGVSVAVTGVAGAVATSTGNSSATAIDTGEKDEDEDTVINSGDLTVNSDALAATATVSVTTAGVAVAGGAAWEGGTKANSQARGIEVGEGADIVDNSGNIDIWSNSVAAEAAVAVAVSGVAGGIATATSDSVASGIDTGDGDYVDKVSNRGDIEATSHSLAATTSVSVTTAGVAVAAGDVWDGGTTAISSARGIEVGKGADEIANEGSVTSEAFAESASANVSVAVAGVAGAIATSSVDSESTALDAGAGEFDDTITNSGNVSSLSSAITASAAVSFTAAGVAVAGDAVWEGGTSSAARSKGIKMGAGNDFVLSEGTVKADTISSATGSSVAIAVLGVAGAIASADSTADSIGIDAGAGDDSIDSRAKITASSFSNGNTIMNADSKFGVSAAGNSAWDGGAKSAATTSGVAGGEGVDELTSSGDMDVDATAVSTSTAVTFTVGGVSASVSTSTANAAAYGIDGGEDDDFIDNTGNLEVDSDANAVSANIALAGIGVAIASDSVWDGGTTSNSSAFGLSGGVGNDFIRSGEVSDDSGLITPLADAVNTVYVKAKSLVSTNSISVTGAGLSVSTTTGTSNADSSAIAAGAGDDTVINASDITSTADAEAYSVSVALTGVGAAIASDAFWDGGTKANADSAGIDGGSGIDQLVNLNSVTSNAESDTVSASLAYSGILSGAVAASTSTAEADGIRGGTGDDELLSAGTINATADAQAVGVSVAISGGVAVAGSFLNKTTVADATAKGMAGGVGDDTLSSEETGAIILNADATAVEASIAASGLMAAAAANAGASATTVGFDGGNDDDLIVNAGSLTQNSTADSVSGSVAFAPGGLGVVADAKASTDALSQGFASGAGNDEVRNSGNVTLTSSAETVGLALSATTAGLAISNASADARADAIGFGGDAGNDRIDNSGDLQIVTDSDAKAAALGVSPVGFTVAAADATAATEVTGLSGGVGEDVLLNSGLVDIDAATSADAVAISASLAGVSIGSATTTADIDVTGVSGGRDNDTLINEESGSIDVLAQADLDSVGVAVTLGGFAEADAATLVLVDTTGIAGDSGDDLITNAGNINIRSQSVSNSTGASVAVFGVAKAKAGGEAQTVATGIDGGDGADTIVNASTGIIRVGPASEPGNDPNNRPDATWMSILRGAAASGTLGGVASAEASAVASTTSTGINGGDSDDSISNLGDIQVTANSLNETGAIAIAIFGSSEAAGDSGAKTLAIGLDGDVGNDHIETLGSLTVDAESRLLHNGAAMTFGGAAGAASTLEARTEGIGITGGDGEDQILSEGNIVVNAGSGMVSSNGASAAFGSSDVAGVSGATTLATGIDGGAADDVIDSAANITLNAISDLRLRGVSITLGGSSSAAGQLAAVTEADALVGGTGNDAITNSGTIIIDASSNMISEAGSATGFGSASASNISGGVTRASGMRGDDGNDVLQNLFGGALRVEAHTSVDTNAVSYTFAGGTDAGTSLTGTSSAEGMRGGDGNDQLSNFGAINVLADAVLRSTGGAEATLTAVGGADSAGISESHATAYGLNAGPGDDLVESYGSLIVDARSNAEVFNNGDNLVSFSSTSKAASKSLAFANSSGVDAGQGINNIYLDGVVDIDASAVAYALSSASGAEISFDGNGDAFAEATAEADATGILSGDNNDLVINNAFVTVDANATTTKEITVDILVYRLIGEGSESETPEDIQELDTLPPLTPSPTSPYKPGTLVISGGVYQIVRSHFVDDDDDPKTDPVEEWYWDVANRIERVVETVTLGEFSTYAFGNGNGFPVGDGAATVTTKTEATAIGAALGGGNDRFENHDDFNVIAESRSIATAGADGDSSGNAHTTSSATAKAYATGVSLGAGNDEVYNTGDINVTASPIARARAAASGGDYCIWFFGWHCGLGGDGFANVSYTSVAEATGIKAGSGELMIINDGVISVAAHPDLDVDNRSGVGYDYGVRAEGADHATYDVDYTASAYGIKADGAGDTTIINNGEILAEAYDLKYLCNTDGCRNFVNVRADVTTQNLKSIGIITGDGNDEVTNNGVVTALLYTGDDGARSQTAITTGAGDDVLVLGDESIVIGDIDLGLDNDTLHLIGNPEVQDALSPGTGNNSLVFEGTGYFANSLAGFNDRALKYGLGTYTVPILPTMQSIEVKSGDLKTESNYAFASNGMFLTTINRDGSHGKLHVVGSTVLEGDLTVLRSLGGPYRDDTRYDIIEAERGITDSFNVVSLPTPTQLLSFQLNQYPDLVEVEVQAKSFTSIATNRVERRLAGYMDTWLATAKGDLNTALGEFQTLSPSEFRQAFLSLSPGQYDSLTMTTFDTTRQFTQTLLQRIHSVRLLGETTSSPNSHVYVDFGDQPVLLAYNGSTESIGRLYSSPEREKAKFGLWLQSFGQWGEQDEEDGFIGYDYDVYGVAIGFDRLFRDRSLFGVSLGYSDTNVDMDQGQGDGDIDTIYGSLYGSFFTDKGYLDAILSYGSQDYDSKRPIVIGAIQGTARSDHDGKSYSAFVEGGLNIDRTPWVLQPFANLQYIYLDEDGFTEEGAGGLSQKIESRDTASLVSELGVRVNPVFQLDKGLLVPEASLAWSYDYDIDDRVIKSSFAGQPNTAFSIDANDVESHGAVIGAGLTFVGKRGFIPSLKYRGEFRDGYHAHGIIGELRWEF